MKFYIATRLESHVAHNEVRDLLIGFGHEIAYDWTTHGPVWRSGVKVIADTAVAEIEGVRRADFVVVILPGGRGTHAELGMALAFGKPTLIASAGGAMLSACPETCAFYWHPLAIHCSSAEPLVIASIADLEAAKPLEKCLRLANDGSGTRCLIRRRDHAPMSKFHPFDGDRERSSPVESEQY
jgi:hypothetical protein